MEECTKPVIAAVHSACIGAGTNLITAADIRYCADDAWFTVKEIDLGLAADIGALQRLPKVIGNQSLVRELCYTGRKLDSKEAYACGLVGRVRINYFQLSETTDLISNNVHLSTDFQQSRRAHKSINQTRRRNCK